MTDTTADVRKALADQIEKKPLGWLPVVGDCVSITFTPDEAKTIVEALRSQPKPDAVEG